MRMAECIEILLAVLSDEIELANTEMVQGF
jgi:hypothetical protein